MSNTVIPTITTGLQVSTHLFLAIFAFICTYPFYKLIITLNMSTTALITINLCFWIVAYTVIYQVTMWKMRGH